MKQRKLYWLIFAIFLLASLIFILTSYFYSKNEKVEAEYPITRVFSYSFSVHNPGAIPVKDVDLFVFSPLKQTANQSLGRVDSTHAFSLVNTEHLAQLIKFEFGTLAPFETKVIKIKAEVSFSSQSNILDSSLESDYLGEHKLIEINDEAIIRQARQLSRESKVETVKAIYDFVGGHIQYAGFVEDDLGAAYALKSKKGDCTEYASLVAALARNNAIPARVVSGFVYPSSGVLKPSDYHAWTEVFVDGKWQIVDALKHNFMTSQDQYLALRFAADGNNSSADSSMRIAYSDKDVIISML